MISAELLFGLAKTPAEAAVLKPAKWKVSAMWAGK